MPLFMPHRSPMENQMHIHNQIHGYAAGGNVNPTLVPPPQSPDPSNPPPIGSSPQNVADNIPAKLSEGEFVMPADVVKFYGVNHFQKLITKAKEGMLQMAQSGMIKGQGNPVPNVPRDEEGAPQEGAPKPEGAAAGGFFAPPGHPDHKPHAYANGGMQSYAGGGFALPRIGTSVPQLGLKHITALPMGSGSPISGMIPHNTGIVHSGIRGPLKNGTALTHASVGGARVKMADGGFMNTDYSTNDYSAGGMPGGMMTPYGSPSAPMTAQPDPNNQQAMPHQYPQTQGLMQPY